jgi:chromosome partitioning protein
MHIIAIGQQKGGVGKSSLAINLACQAVAGGKVAAVVDMDAEQGTTARWGKRRSEAEPLVIAADARTLGDALAKLRGAGAMWAFLDLPGRSAPIATAGMRAAEFVLIPCRPVDVDIEASITTVQGIVRSGKAYAYLMNIVPQGSAGRAKKVLKALEDAGHPTCPVIIGQKADVPDAIAGGKGINEVSGKGAASKDFAELFAWLNEQVRRV